MMPQKVPGGPNYAEGAQLRETSKQASIMKEGVQLSQTSTSFPVLPYPYDPYTEIYDTKSQFASNAGGLNWNVPFTEKDAQYVMSQKTKENQFNFDRWVELKYDITDPAQAIMLQQIAPELFERKEELIKYKSDLSLKYAQLRLRGPRTIDDLKLEFMVEQGFITLPSTPLHDATVQAGDRDATLRAGWWSVFNLRKAFTPNPNNRADIYGNPLLLQRGMGLHRYMPQDQNYRYRGQDGNQNLGP